MISSCLMARNSSNILSKVSLFSNPDGVYWSLDIEDKDTPATHYEFRGGKGDDLVEISGYIDSLDSRSVVDGESFGTNFFDGGDGYDTIKIDAPSKKFELRHTGYDVDGYPEYVLQSWRSNAHFPYTG